MASYVIVTAAYNEEDSLDRLVQCVSRQTVKPLIWIIVSDGSTDKTDEIAQRHAAQTPWIRFLRREKSEQEQLRVEKVAPGKVAAIQMALASIKELDYQYFANLDADVTFEPSYCQRVLEKFEADNSLGLAGGMMVNILPDGTQAPGGFRNPEAVGGAMQMFRRRCYEDIGGYKPYGHEDGIACAEAERKGWKVRSYPDIWAQHHTPYHGYAPTVRSKVPTCFYLGMMNYVLRMPLWFDAILALRACCRRPFVIAGLSWIAGHLWAMATRKRELPKKSRP